MMKSMKMVATATLLVVTALTIAQPGGGGGGGRGQGRGMMMMGPGGGQNKIMLLVRKDVRDDLALSAEQSKKLEDMQAKIQEEMRSMFQNAQAGGGGMQERMEDMRKMQEGYTKQIEAVLTPEQNKRLGEISVQLRGNSAIQDPEIQKELGLTTAQKDQIDALSAKQREAMMALRERVQNGEIEREQMGEIMQKNRKIMGDELAKILTPEQSAKLKEMGGKPFKADPNEQGMRRIGGGGGGGGL